MVLIFVSSFFHECVAVRFCVLFFFCLLLHFELYFCGHFPHHWRRQRRRWWRHETRWHNSNGRICFLFVSVALASLNFFTFFGVFGLDGWMTIVASFMIVLFLIVIVVLRCNLCLRIGSNVCIHRITCETKYIKSNNLLLCLVSATKSTKSAFIHWQITNDNDNNNKRLSEWVCMCLRVYVYYSFDRLNCFVFLIFFLFLLWFRSIRNSM